MKKIIASILSVIILVSLAALNVYAATEYTLEAENYTDTNWKYIGGRILISKTGASGGKYISLKMDTDKESEFYSEYVVNVASAGYYKITLYSTPVTKTGWASPVYVKVNGGNDIALDGIRGENETVSGTGIFANESDVIYLNSGDNTVRFIVKDKNDDGKYISSFDKIKFTSASYALDGIYSDNPYMVFESGNPVSIYAKGNGITNTNVSVSYTVKKYNSNSSVASGTITIPAGQKTGSVSVSNLDKGSYIISATYSGKTVTEYFSVVTPKSSRSVYADTPFAIDTNMISLYNKYSDKKDYVDNYAKALSLMGVSWIRDRISMSSTVTKTGDTITATASANNYIGKEIKKYGNIKITAVVNDIPSWMVGSDKKLKCDAVDVYKAFKALGDALGNSVDAIEILNETDAGGNISNSDSPNIYAAFFKAATAGINDSLSNAAVISQGATAIRALDYIDTLYKNDVFKFSVADNYHFHYNYLSGNTSAYSPFKGINAISQIIAMQKENAAKKPIWITEAGILFECESDTELSSAQQYVQAKYLITSAAEAIANGVDKNFYFLGTEYQEGDYTTGIMSKNDDYPSFYPAFAAMSAMTDLLGEGRYLGNLNSGNVRAYVFNNGVKNVIVAYSTSGSKTFTPQGTYKKYDMFGNLISGTSGNISVTEEPVFIVLDGAVNSADTSNAHSVSEIIPTSVTTGDHIIVSQDYSDNASVGSRNDEYYISAYNNTVTVTVSNLNNEAVSGTLNPESNADWTFSPSSRDFTLGALESATYTFTIGNYADTKEALVSFKAVCGDIQSSASVAKVKSGSDEYTNNAQRYWIDATNYNEKTGAYEQTQFTDAVNGRVMRVFTKDYEQPLVDSTLTYKFSLPSAGTYNVWMLVSDSNANHVTKWKWRYESPDSYRRYTYSYNPSAVYDAGTPHMYWYKVDSNKSLSAGTHYIVVKSDALRGGTYNDYMLQILDSIVIVPTSDTWWNPSSKTNGENVIAFENRNFASNFDFTNLTEDVQLPSKTDTGATISWSTSNCEVIDNNGKITRGLVTRNASLTATLTYDSSSTTVNIPVSVAPTTEIIPNVTLVDGNDNVITEFNKNRDNYVRVSFANPFNENKAATVYVAGYDNETNELKYLKKTVVEAGSKETASPDDILIDGAEDVGTYKIFTWKSNFESLLGSTTMLTSVIRDDACVTISGNCGKANEKLTMTVVKADAENFSSMSDEDVYDNLCYIGETTTDSEGKYVLKFRLTNANGKYKVNVRYSGGSTQSLFVAK